jgi:hypothetical protein
LHNKPAAGLQTTSCGQKEGIKGMASKIAVSKSTVAKYDVVMIAVLLACATAIIIESHNRILIGSPVDGERFTSVAAPGPYARSNEAASHLDQLTAP